MIARVIQTEGTGSISDGAVANLNDDVIPTLKKQPGFVAAYWMVDASGNGTTVVLWEDAESDSANEAQIETRRRETLEKAGRHITKNEAQKVVAHSR
jgi:quinol monooxygenase YgiN